MVDLGFPSFFRSFVYWPSGLPWTFVGTAGVAANGSAFTATNPDAPQGNQVLFLQHTGVATQTINLQPGTYTVSLMAAQRKNFPGEQTIQFKVNNILVASFKPSGYDYEAFSATFTLQAAEGENRGKTGVSSRFRLSPQVPAEESREVVASPRAAR